MSLWLKGRVLAMERIRQDLDYAMELLRKVIFLIILPFEMI